MFALRMKQLRIGAWLLLFKIASFFIKSDHWIISERGTEARDNGYSFYKYMKKNHPEQKVYFLITKDSADFYKVREDALAFNSIKSFWLILTAKKIVSAHYASVLPMPDATKIFHLFRLYKNFYFLQHGIIKDNMKSLYAERSPMKLFVCGAKPEYEYILENYGHPAGVVKYTGLARFDFLHDNHTIQKQILVMPTWRTHIRSKQDLLESAYYANWQQLLQSQHLAEELRKNNLKLVFYVHYEMQKYIDLFHTESENIVIASFDEYDVQRLLKESALLITDYSSVYFDFAYMKKPVLYYQFDQYHYEKGYFDYTTMGFGEVCSNYDKLMECVCKQINARFVMEPLYVNRVDDFFLLHDRNNCERIYNAILENESLCIH